MSSYTCKKIIKGNLSVLENEKCIENRFCVCLCYFSNFSFPHYCIYSFVIWKCPLFIIEKKGVTVASCSMWLWIDEINYCGIWIKGYTYIFYFWWIFPNISQNFFTYVNTTAMLAISSDSATKISINIEFTFKRTRNVSCSVVVMLHLVQQMNEIIFFPLTML